MASLVDELPDISVRTVYGAAEDKLARIKSLLITGRLIDTKDEFIAAKTLIEFLPKSYASKFLQDWFNELLTEAKLSIQAELRPVSGSKQ